MPDTVADIMHQKLSAQYGAGSITDLLRQFWSDKGYGDDPPTGKNLLDFYFTDGGAVGDTVIDRRLDYWTNYFTGVSTKHLQLIWDIFRYTDTATALEFIWNVSQITTQDLQIIWDVDATSSLTPTSKDIDLVWNVLVPASKDAQFLWDIYTSPSAISDLKAWYKADTLGLANGTAVSSWTDSSGNGFAITQATGAKQPIFRTAQINSLPALEFDGVDDTLYIAGSSISQDAPGLSILVVLFSTSLPASAFDRRPVTMSITDESLTRWAFRTSQATIGSLNLGARRVNADAFQAISPNGTHVAGELLLLEGITDYINTDIFLYKNGILVGSNTAFQTSGNSDNSASGRFSVGALSQTSGDVSFWHGLIAEVIVYHKALSSGERLDLERYLGHKYGITVP